MFEWRESEKRWDAVHHPFTSPQVEGELPDFIAEMKKDPGKVQAFQYDFVLNGYEIAGGSIRTHQPELLSAVFEIMGHTAAQIEKKFGHILEAFKYGVPPHGGIAPGIDRFLAIVSNEPNIRDVIAFPKTGDARDLMMDSPSELDAGQLKELHLKIGK
jgi:aspartyl-tRNA synthetase